MSRITVDYGKHTNLNFLVILITSKISVWGAVTLDVGGSKARKHIYISLMLADPTTWIAVAPADLPL